MTTEVVLASSRCDERLGSDLSIWMDCCAFHEQCYQTVLHLITRLFSGKMGREQGLLFKHRFLAQELKCIFIGLWNMPTDGEEYKGYCRLCKKETTHVLHYTWDTDGNERQWLYFCLGCGTRTQDNYKQSTMIDYLF